jgi:hypothetical protein
MSFRITREQRDVLYAEAIHSLDDIIAPLLSGALDELEAFHALRPRHEAVMRLLDDLGWAASDPGERFELTMPGEQLAVAVQRLADLVMPYVKSRTQDRPAEDDALAAQVHLDHTVRDLEADAHLTHCVSVLAAAGSLIRRTGPAPDPAPLMPHDGGAPAALPDLMPAQRDLLYRATRQAFRNAPTLLTSHLYFDEVAQAKAARAHCESMWRLLDDLGWKPEDPRERFPLTLSAVQAALALARVQVDASAHARDHADDATATDAIEQDYRVAALCHELLYALPAGTAAAVLESQEVSMPTSTHRYLSREHRDLLHRGISTTSPVRAPRPRFPRW